jgi:hypothetical protein
LLPITSIWYQGLDSRIIGKIHSSFTSCYHELACKIA